MKLSNLRDCYIYSSSKKKIDGETHKKWTFKDKKRLNVQQDINELDRNSAGLVDFDKLKIRVDYDINLEKNDGISLYEIPLEDGYTTEAPKYKVVASPKVGKTTTYTCEIYHGE